MNNLGSWVKSWKDRGMDLFRNKMRPAIKRQYETSINPFADFSWGDTNWSGLAGTAVNMLGDGINGAVGMDEKQKFYANSIFNYGQGAYDNLTDNSSLIMAGMMPAMSSIRQKDIRDKSWGEDIGSSLANGLSAGLSTGNPYIGIGVAALDFGNSLRERLTAKRTAEELEGRRRDRMRLLGDQYYIAAQGVDERNDFNRMMSYFENPYDYAFGGSLHSNGGDYNGGLTYIDEGGRHEENPYEGVPSGFDEEGNPNLVEEGEVIWNNEYVFSDRLKVPKELATKYKLGGKKDYTFAEAIEKLTKENTISPNDFITIATTKEIVNEFMDAQEAVREQEQIAAREELEAAQAQDFLAQLNAAQGMAPPMGAPIDMGQMSMGMPNEAPVTEGEMMPPGYAFGGPKKSLKEQMKKVLKDSGVMTKKEKARQKLLKLQNDIEGLFTPPSPEQVVSIPQHLDSLFRGGQQQPEAPFPLLNEKVEAFGGNKFDGGGRKDGSLFSIWTDKKTGQTYYTLPNGESYNSLQKAQTRVAQLGEKIWDTPSYNSSIDASVVTASRKSAEKAAQSTVDVSKIYKKQTGYDTKGQPVYQYTIVDPNNGKKYTYSSYEAAAQKYSSIPRKVNDPRVKGGYAYVTPYGDVHINEKDAKDSLNKRMHPQSTSKSTVKTSQSKGIGTTAMAAEPPVRTIEAPVPTVTRPTVEPERLSSTAPTGSTSKPSSGSGSTGRMRTPSGNTINYRRDINGKEWEAAEPYQNFLSYIRGKGKDSPEAKEWMDYIQSEIKNSGSRYELKDFDDWSRLAEDGKVGPVHQATLKAAEYFAKRQGLQAVDPNGLNPTIGDILGVKPENIRSAPINPAPQTPQTPSGSGTTQKPSFNYRDTSLRYAPVIGSAMAALHGMLNRPDYFNADRIIDAANRMGTPINIPVETIGDYRRRNPFDERYLVNMANQNRVAAARGIANTAGGNRAMDLLGNMSLAHSSQYDLGEIMRQAYLANRQDDAQVAEFNRGTNVYNMNAINQRNISQAQLNTHRQQAGLSGLTQGYGLRQGIKDSWDSATMESLNSMLASLGAIGKENEEYNILTSMAEQGYFPHYYRDRGIIDFVRPTKNGGKLNRKKRRF